MADPTRSRPLLALLVFAAALLLYARTATFPFVEYDDPQYVRANEHLAGGLSAASARWALTSTGYQYNWHPLTWLSHALDVELFGLDAGKHHLVNALLHALGAALLYLALSALTGSHWPSAWAAGLFALHPLRVESVAWIAERKDVLAGVFFALTLLGYARYVRAPSVRRLAAVALALGLGLMAKPTLVTLPCLLLVLDVWPLRRLERSIPAPGRDVGEPSPTPTLLQGTPAETRRQRSLYGLFLEKLPLFGLSLASIALTLLSQRAGGAVSLAVPLAERLENAAIAYVQYLGQWLWPAGLAVFYPHPALVWPGMSRFAPALGAVVLLLALSAVAFRQRHARPWLLAGWCWFLGLLVPMIGLVQVGDMARADRYAYLSLIGVEIALAWTAAELALRRPVLRGALVGGATLALLACAALAWRQIGRWRSSQELFEHAIAVTDRNFVAENQLGLALGEQRLDEALQHFEAARAARPGFFQAELNVGKARWKKEQWDSARAAFERAVSSSPGSAEARLCLAAALERTGELERADRELATALELDPTLLDDPRALQLARRLEERLRSE